MTDKNNDTEKATESVSKYASLTSGLLARKGEAVPAAAAFTAEAIAQHIPARRLAQEAKRHAGAFSALEHEMRPLQSAMQAQQLAELNDAIEEEHAEFANSLYENDMADSAAFLSEESDEYPADNNGQVTPIDFDQIVTEALADVDQRRTNAGLRAMKRKFLGAGGSTDPDPRVLSDRRKSDGPDAKPCAAKRYSEEMKRQMRSKSAEPMANLDPRRFIRLQIAAMKLGMMPQDIFSVAVDTYLDQLDEEVFSECNCLKKGIL